MPNIFSYLDPRHRDNRGFCLGLHCVRCVSCIQKISIKNSLKYGIWQLIMENLKWNTYFPFYIVFIFCIPFQQQHTTCIARLCWIKNSLLLLSDVCWDDFVSSYTAAKPGSQRLLHRLYFSATFSFILGPLIFTSSLLHHPPPLFFLFLNICWYEICKTISTGYTKSF